jgi:hypothetical protein
VPPFHADALLSLGVDPAAARWGGAAVQSEALDVAHPDHPWRSRLERPDLG